MGTTPAKVLLIGGNGMRFSPAAEHLAERGCECHLVSGCLDGARLLGRNSFDLILCSGRTRGFQELVSAVLRSSASLFRYLSVEDGGWWVPTVSRGQRCLDAPGFRDAEFGEALNAFVTDVQSAPRPAHCAAPSRAVGTNAA